MHVRRYDNVKVCSQRLCKGNCGELGFTTSGDFKTQFTLASTKLNNYQGRDPPSSTIINYSTSTVKLFIGKLPVENQDSRVFKLVNLDPES